MVYVVLVEAYVQAGENVIEAIEKVDEYCGLTRHAEAVQQDGQAPVDRSGGRVPTEAENERALAELQKMMMGVGR